MGITDPQVEIDRRYILLAGVPRAGKSSLADWVAEADARFAHVPLDRYIRPVPPDMGPTAEAAFVAWVKTPSCIDWDLLGEHMGILAGGEDCRTPKPDWSQGGVRLSSGGRGDGPGRLMPAGREYYMVVGTHAYAFADNVPGLEAERAVKVFVDTPKATIAARLHGGPVPAAGVAGVIRRSLGDNCEPLLAQRPEADLVLSGTADRRPQYEALVALLGLDSALAASAAEDGAVNAGRKGQRQTRGDRRQATIEKRRRNRQKARQERRAEE